MVKYAFLCDLGFLQVVSTPGFATSFSDLYESYTSTSLASLASYKLTLPDDVEYVVVGCLSFLLADVKVSKVERREITISK